MSLKTVRLQTGQRTRRQELGEVKALDEGIGGGGVLHTLSYALSLWLKQQQKVEGGLL